MIYLVRHAHAGVRVEWPGHDGDRPLSKRGWREAAGIAAALAGLPVTRMLSSPHRRCRETLQPLAAAQGLPVEVEPGLAVGTDPADAARLLADAQPGTVLCTHGEVVADLIAALAAAGIDLDGPRTTEKGAIWELSLADGAIRSGRYRPPAG